jgi:hypothetical protein
MLRIAIGLVLCLVAAATSGCAANTAVDCSGPCTDSHHIWDRTEVAADLWTNPFPPAATRRDHLYKIHCQITHAGKGATLRWGSVDGPASASPHRCPTSPTRQRLVGSDLLAESIVAVRSSPGQGATRTPRRASANFKLNHYLERRGGSRSTGSERRAMVRAAQRVPAQRSDLNASRSSDEKISGSSHAAKWPPFSTSLK